MCKGPATDNTPAVSTDGFDAKEAEKKAQRKAEKRAAKLAAAEAAVAAEVAEVAGSVNDSVADEEAAAKAARKAEKKAAKLAAQLEEERANAKALKKALKAAEKEKQETDATMASEEASVKRKAAAVCEEAKEPAAAAVEPAAKKQKAEDGVAVLGAVDYRKKEEITVTCDGECPAPFETFASACPEFGKALEKALLAQGYAAPTPIQAQCWPIALQGRDMVAVASTGSGKTCGFLLPAIARIAERGPTAPPSRWGRAPPAKPTVLVVAPTRELAQQIHGEAEKFAPAVKARSVCIFGGVPKGDQCRELKSGCDILIATPGRLLDLCAGQPDRGLPPSVDLSAVNYLVLDEADRMLDMGFEDDIRKVIEMCPQTGEPAQGGGATGSKAGTARQTLFFTATWPKEVQQTAWSFTSQDAVQIRIGQSSGDNKLTANKMVKQVVTICDESEKSKLLQDCLAKELKDGETCIVFAGMKATCDELERELHRAKIGCWCKAIHSGKEQWERDAALQEFRDLTAGKAGSSKRGIMVATDVAARGLDIPGVALVVVYEFGGSQGVESYVHRIGRTGRAGLTGRAFTFFTRRDKGSSELVELLKGADQEVPAELEDLAWHEWGKKSRKGGKGKGKGKGKGGKGKGSSKGKGGSSKGGGRGWGK